MSQRPESHGGSDEWAFPDQAVLADLLPPLDDRPGPARRLSSTASTAMVRSIVDAALARQAESLAAETESLPPARSWEWRRVLAPAAAVLLVISFGAGAAALVGRYVFDLPVDPVAPPPVRQVRSRERAVTPPAPAQQLLVPAPASPPEPSPRQRKVKHPRPKSAMAPLGAPVAMELDLETAPPEDLLALANERRRERVWNAADQLYRAVMSRFPGSDAALVAEIASAALHLEQLGDPGGALRAFRRALSERPTGPLAEEARWGIVEATRALGDAAQESAALSDFLAHHPSSALAPAARRRLSELAR
jgi:hypothetical protein